MQKIIFCKKKNKVLKNNTLFFKQKNYYSKKKIKKQRTFIKIKCLLQNVKKSATKTQQNKN